MLDWGAIKGRRFLTRGDTVLLFCLNMIVACGDKDDDTSVDVVDTAEEVEEVEEEDTSEEDTAEDTAEEESVEDTAE